MRARPRIRFTRATNPNLPLQQPLERRPKVCGGRAEPPSGDFINGGDGSSSLLPVPSVPRPAPAAAVPGLPREQPRSPEIASDWMTLAHILKGVEAPGYLGAPEPPPGGGLGRGRCRGRPRDALVGLGEGKAEELPEGKRADSSNPALAPGPHIQTRPAPSSS